ncbi:antibiotic biosynthesis monooxygenase [Chitinophaga barathri]|uniref:ABM domain-containing protein n=1 Tax=Chitinophaga barathri TaxID=1647451 RepID=A0A3N4MP44_9BACT|nr:antibiotic biosynthesis monooxygenase [Chitinophaga barathri]RPD41439.1 hypothetical protein EG028_08960 [Chitinophaga barathri]
MITVKVTYTVSAEFAQRNIANVNTFMQALRQLNNPAIRYVSYLGEDGKTFTHIAQYDNAAAQREFLAMPAFLEFQRQRDASGLEKPQHVETMQVVAASYDLFTSLNS